ncbi:conserved hypothetical protein [Nitrospira defluvii]|uniref:Uncharacterized protein n=1 Tax=Nitrospira defluvii TaxID=330214 RepID=A0ABN7LUL4_9BACT|nr:conserved hypothetical protein [Nitrospira defluvii]
MEKARAELREWDDRFERYDGNNPDKYQSQIRSACRRVRNIEDELKRTGVIPLTEYEQLCAALDKAFPTARSKQIVEYQGKCYKKRYLPLDTSRPGKTLYRGQGGYSR